MKQYQDLLKDILENGSRKQNRTGVDTIGVFGRQIRFNLQDGFPALTTKKIHMKSVVYELLWFLRGDTNIKYLQDNGVTIWNAWADENGEIGPTYGHNWTKWPVNETTTLNQIAALVYTLKTNPNDRRMLVNAWNPATIYLCKLPPCHYGFTCNVTEGKLNLMWRQRSVDTFLGLAFNICSYALLTHMLAQVSGLEVGELIGSLEDTHLYVNHLDQVAQQLTRTPRKLPTLKLNSKIINIFDFKYEDFELQNYDPYPAIKAEVAV
jgi:thymidylate synthase